MKILKKLLASLMLAGIFVTANLQAMQEANAVENQQQQPAPQQLALAIQADVIPLAREMSIPEFLKSASQGVAAQFQTVLQQHPTATRVVLYTAPVTGIVFIYVGGPAIIGSALIYTGICFTAYDFGVVSKVTRGAEYLKTTRAYDQVSRATISGAGFFAEKAVNAYGFASRQAGKASNRLKKVYVGGSRGYAYAKTCLADGYKFVARQTTELTKKLIKRETRRKPKHFTDTEDKFLDKPVDFPTEPGSGI